MSKLHAIHSHEKIPMQYKDKSIIYWSVKQVKDFQGRLFWIFIDDTGYERFGGYIWSELVLKFQSVASNYNLVTNLN